MLMLKFNSFSPNSHHFTTFVTLSHQKIVSTNIKEIKEANFKDSISKPSRHLLIMHAIGCS